jgi:hypothetical protein
MPSITPKSTIALCLSVLFFAPSIRADQHLVPLADLHQKAVEKSQNRDANLKKLQSVLEIEPARKAISASGMDVAGLRQAAALLSDDELARLGARAEQASNDFAAGALSNQQITYILIALATAVIVLVLVH